jgi:hypothetical protein
MAVPCGRCVESGTGSEHRAFASAIDAAVMRQTWGIAASPTGTMCGNQIRGLLDRPRTTHEDVYKPPGALLPVRVGRRVGDADKSPK